MLEIEQKAKEKTEGELKEFREKIEKMKAMDVYNMAGVIIFTEATIYHLQQLMSSEELCTLICKEDVTLEGAVQYIISNVRKKYGMTGDLPVEEFQQLIWDYYKIDHSVAKKALEEKASMQVSTKKKIEQPNLIDMINKDTNTENKKLKINIKKTPSPKAGPLQISLFDLGGDANE